METVWMVAGDDVLALKLASPTYDAVTEIEPAT